MGKRFTDAKTGFYFTLRDGSRLEEKRSGTYVSIIRSFSTDAFLTPFAAKQNPVFAVFRGVGFYNTNILKFRHSCLYKKDAGLFP